MNSLHANPYPYSFELKHTALMIIDMQRDFILPGGFGESLGNDVTRLSAIVPTLERLLLAWREAGGVVVHTREAHLPDLSDCPPSKLERGHPSQKIGDQGPMGRLLVRGEWGSDIIDELTPLPGELLIDKPGKGAFYNTDLHTLLQSRGITHLVITGVTTEVCVQTTMREANDRGYECVLIEDATQSYFESFWQSTLEMIRAQGAIVGWTAQCEDLLLVLKKG
jgi:nicotinamidase-related amidase